MKTFLVFMIGLIIGVQVHIALADFGDTRKKVIEVYNENDSQTLPQAVEEVEEKEKTITEKIVNVFGEEGELALAIAKAESGLNPKAMNTNSNTGDYSIGIFQINLIGNLFDGRLKRARHLGYTGEGTREALTEWLQDEDNNINYAYSMSRTNGWSAWSTYKHGKHLKYLK